MSDQTSSTAASGACCGAADGSTTPSGTTTRAAGSTAACCGTAEAAARAGACCDPTARSEALAAGADCCVPTDTAASSTTVARTGPAGLPVVVIGAGPVGLAAAGHLHERRLPFLVLEAGSQVGASVRQWGQVRLFSPWRYNIDHAARRLLDAAGWDAPDPESLPTGADLVERYLRPLAKLPAIAPHLRLDARVVAISRDGVDRVRTAGRADVPFVVRLADGTDIAARAVIDASGTWSHPNVLGANGLPAHGETDAAAWIDHALPDVLGADRDRYAGRHTVVVGAGHSAATTLLALAELAEQAPGTAITWAIRGGSPAGRTAAGPPTRCPPAARWAAACGCWCRPAGSAWLTGFAVHSVRPVADGSVALIAHGGDRTITADVSSPPPATGPTTRSPPNCASTSTRFSAPPAPSRR